MKLKKILIADSGSTKTDWAVVMNGQVIRSIQTKGMNPYLQTEEEICEELRLVLMPQLDDERLDAVYFYGAGCVFDKAEMMQKALVSCMQVHQVEVYSDLLGAAHSVCGRSAGIACILGTGSNSCFYDGEKIVKNISPLGFILGDEGGGAVMGRMLVGDVLKEVMPPEIREAFFDRFKLTQAEILDRVYKQPFPNRFLAGLSPFVKEHIHVPEMHALVKNNFKLFLKRNVRHYHYADYTTHCVGSIAYHYKEILMETAEAAGVRIGTVIKSPLEGLSSYYGI